MPLNISTVHLGILRSIHDCGLKAVTISCLMLQISNEKPPKKQRALDRFILLETVRHISRYVDLEE